jgi:hypothetical protein
VASFYAAHFGLLPEREVIERLMAAWHLVASAEALDLDRKHTLRLFTVSPSRDELGDLAGLPKVGAFYEHQVGRGPPV